MLFVAAQNLSWALLLTFQVISYGSYTILVHLCEENGQIQFNSSSMNLLIELLKLKFSLICYAIEKFFSGNPFISKKNYSLLNDLESNNNYNNATPLKHLKPLDYFRKSLSFSAPAFLYFINNNLAVYIQLYMDATSYQMLSNLKILTTACLYYFFLGGKSLTKSKIVSLVLLFIAGLIYSFANLKSLSNYYIDEIDLQSLFSSLDLRGEFSASSSKKVTYNLLFLVL